MKIKAIEQTRSPNGKLRLCFDEGTNFLVYPPVIAELGLYIGKELSEEDFRFLQERSAEASAKERALRIISATSVSEKELHHRLVQKGEREDNADNAVSWLKELKLLDDSRVAEQIVRNGAAKGYGAARIRQMLYEKRVPKELWQEALKELPQQDDQIDTFLARRFRGKQPDRKECKRAADALLRRGHSWSDIRRALERYSSFEEEQDVFYED